jgi:hypothetical protein
MSSFQIRAAVGPLLAGLVVSGLGCSERQVSNKPGPQGWLATDEPQNALPVPFVVDDHFHPSNCYDDPKTCSTVVFDSTDCGTAVLPRPQGAQGQCHGYRYTPIDESGYGGVMSVHSPKGEANWGDFEGRAIEPGARKVTFYAAAPDGSQPKIYFNVGGVDDPALAFRDTLKIEQVIILGAEFQKYEISLEGRSYDKIIGAFGWAMLGSDGLSTFEFYLDDVRWE